MFPALCTFDTTSGTGRKTDNKVQRDVHREHLCSEYTRQHTFCHQPKVVDEVVLGEGETRQRKVTSRTVRLGALAI
jgi:hypothetical protein